MDGRLAARAVPAADSVELDVPDAGDVLLVLVVVVVVSFLRELRARSNDIRSCHSRANLHRSLIHTGAHPARHVASGQSLTDCIVFY